MTRVGDYRGNPIDIEIGNDELVLNKVYVLKDFVDSYIYTCNSSLDEKTYEEIIETFSKDVFVTVFENSLGFENGTVLDFVKKYYKNYLS